MFQVIFKSMLVTAVRDKITVFYSLAFPLLMMVGLGYYFNQGQQQLQIVAGITAISTIFWGMQGIAFQVHAQRNRGVYKLVKLTPMPLILFIFIMVLARTSVGVLINFIIWLTGILLFDINAAGSTLLITFLLIVIGTLCFTSIGFVISNFARNEAQISMVSNFIQLPMIFMSEAFYSLDRAPAWVVFIGKMLPFEHYVKALRDLLLAEEGTLWIGFGTLFVYLLFALFLSIPTFKWESSEEKRRSWKKRTS